MRLLSFLLIFLGIAILVVGSIVWFNRETFQTVFQNREAIMEGSEWVEKTYSLGGFIEFMAEQPQHASVLSIPVPSGSNDPVIRYQTDEMYPAGTLSNMLLLISYVAQTQSGSINPGTPVDTEKLASFYIPGLDRRHERMFRAWLDSDGPNPSVSDLVRYLSRNNDPAASDYLFFLLGEVNIAELAETLGEGLIEPPIPQFGIRMMALEHLDAATFRENLNKLAQMPRDLFLEKALSKARDQWLQPRQVTEKNINSFQDQRMLNGLYPRMQPDRFASLLSSIWMGTLINETVSGNIRQLYEQIPQDRLMKAHAAGYASHFDERMSFLSGWTAARMADGTSFRIQVILIVDVPAGLWFHMNSNFMIQDYHNRMLYDAGLQSRTYDLLMQPAHAGSFTFSRPIQYPSQTAGMGTVCEHRHWYEFLSGIRSSS